jgi:hypothetical protein
MPKISQLPTLINITTGSIIPVVENFTTQKLSVGKLFEFLSGALDETFTTEVELLRSASGITSSFEAFTSSVDARLDILETPELALSASQISILGFTTTGSNTFTQSQTISEGNSLLVNRIENTTGGNIEIAASGLLSLSGDGGGVITNDNFEANPGGNATFKVTSGSVSITGSIYVSGTPLISSSAQITALGFISESITDTGSLLLTSSFNTFSSSVHQRIIDATNEQVIDGFLTTSSFNDFSGSVHQRLLDATNEQILDGFVITSSFDNYTSSNDTKVNSLVNKTGSLATTGSNTFNGNQTINGSVTLDNGAIIKDNANNSISFGYLSAEINQGTQSVAIGNGAGYTNQSNGAVALGTNAGAINQGQRALALGSLAGTNTQGEYAVAIGNFAAPNNQAANSIVISAMGSGLENTTANSLKIEPIRNVTGSSGILQYDSTTKEVSYSDNLSNYGVITSSNTSSFATTGSNTFVGNQIVSGTLTIATNGGDEGGEILLGKAVTNTTLTGSGVVVDIFRDRVRIFEESGTTRGAFLNVASQSSGVSSQIVTSPNLFSIQTITSASYAALTPVSGTLYVIIG